MNKSITSPTQWHPPFVGAMRITLEKDEKNIEMQPEYSIQALPSRMDLCIILRNPRIPIHKSIGKIFRKYNLVEYKPQGKSMTYNNYCYMLGNVYLMKARGDGKSISLEEISITLVSYNFPGKLIRKLKSMGRIIQKIEQGLYHIKGEAFAIQVVVLNKLDQEEYLWLTSLHKGLREKEQDRLVKAYRSHRGDKLYREVMDFIVSINKEDFERRKGMSEVLYEIFRPQLEERMRQELREKMQKEIQREMQKEIQREMQQEKQEMQREIQLEKQEMQREKQEMQKKVRQEILGFLKEQGEVSEDVQKRITDETMMERLWDWLRKAARAESVEEFVAQMGLLHS